MTKAQLKLGKELQNKIKKNKKERAKAKKAFDKVVLIHKQDKSKVIIEANKTFIEFPLVDFMIFLESRIIFFDNNIKNFEEKFIQL